MTEHDFAGVLGRYVDGWNQHDAAASAACYAEDGSLTINGGEPAVGRLAVQKVIQGFHDSFPGAVLTVDAARNAGDQAVYLWTYEGKSVLQRLFENYIAENGGRVGSLVMALNR